MDIESNFDNLSRESKDFLTELSIFLTSIALQHKERLRSSYLEQYLLLCRFVLFLSKCTDREIVKVCMDFWKVWAHDIYDTYKKV